MKNLYLITILLLLLSCGSDNLDPSHTDNQINTIDSTTTKNSKSALDSLHPNNLSEDLSWIVNLDIQEGFLLAYTITYQSGDEITKQVKDLDIGGVDHPAPYFINDTTYYIPNIGASKNGHYEMYIYYSGNAEYKEIKSN